MTEESEQRELGPKAVTRMMLRTLWSTTARVFVPVTALFLVGLAIDLNTATKPWGMAIGAGAGIVMAIVLVAVQLKGIRKTGSGLVQAGEEK